MTRRRYNARKKTGQRIVGLVTIKERFRRGKKAYGSDTENRSTKWKALAHRYYENVILRF